MVEEVGFIGLFVMVFIVAVVGTSLISPIAQETGNAVADGNISTSPASVTLLNLNTLMYSILILGSVAGLTFLGLRLSGLV